MADPNGNRTLSPYWHLIKAQVRSQASYRASFILDLAGNLLMVGMDVLGVLVLFQVTPVLGGFTLAEVLVIVALSQAAFTLADLAVGNVERLKFYVRTGLMDAILVRPLRALPQLLAVDFAARRVTRVLYAYGLLAVALAYAGVDWTPARAAMVVLAPICGAVLFSAIFVAGATVAFWWTESGELANSLTYGGRDFTAYPVNIYSGWFRKVFAFGIGFAFVAYYPALVLLGKPDPLGLPAGTGWAAPAVAGVAAGLAALVWRTGVRHYRSTGS